jgi:hypothetical protein
MNAFDKDFTGLAQLEYGDADYLILKPGSYVVCAVTGEQIPIAQLKYWSADLQEAYKDAVASTKRWLQAHGGPAGAPAPEPNQ